MTKRELAELSTVKYEGSPFYWDEGSIIRDCLRDEFEAGFDKALELVLTPELLEVGRKEIENVLIEWRDNRLSEFMRGNGLVVREKDGQESSIIRFGPETALKIGIEAMKRKLGES